MIKRTLASPTLVLNKSWVAIRIEPAKRSFSKAFRGKAQFMDEADYSLYDCDTWLESFGFKIPEVIVLTTYNKVPKTVIKLTRKNVMIRDNFTDQYTGEKLLPSEATIDHIIPRSKGGKNTWNNVVICHRQINSKKGSRTPEEAGLTLLSEPRRPQWSPLYSKIVSNRPDSWNKFVNWRPHQ